MMIMMIIMEYMSKICLNKCMVKREFVGMIRNYNEYLFLFKFGGVSLFSFLNIDSFVNVSMKFCHKRKIYMNSVNFVNDTTALSSCFVSK